MKQFPPQRDYSSLSVRDLVEARDAYHTHLSHLTNVTATAIGRYRIHEDDWYAEHSPAEARPADVKPVTARKTLYNTVVRPWSWPCVLVFVDHWLEREEFVHSPDQMVPRALFLPDGRVIPTCTILVERQDAPAARDDAPSFPKSLVGGGFLLTTRIQGVDHFGSVGCLVSDGRATYALTNQHVAGRPGDEIATILRGTRVPVGVAAEGSIRKIAFSDAYPGWPGTQAVSNLDVGLVDVADVSLWTSQIVGLGTIGTPLDLNVDNITVDLIHCPVRAFGGASGPLSGRIAALFYRYKSIGGTDYISDLLIAPNAGTTTRPGDSGTMWCLVDEAADQSDPLRPLAMQWGGHVFVDAGHANVAQGLALATFVSTICRELDVDVLRGVNSGLPEYWGDVGHYTIGAKACQLLSHNANLSTLMMANLDRIAYGDDNIAAKSFKTTTQQRFQPLADVPDKVWKPPLSPAPRGNHENPNHFADMDKPNSSGKTLLELTKGADGRTDPSKVTVEIFQTYYDDIHDRSRGLLPFRVWQFYDLMVEAAKAGNAAGFVAAGGVMAHYVGDSCQPLHISYKFNGDPGRKGADGETYAKGVHEGYESDMLRAHAPEMLSRLNDELGISPGHLGNHGYQTFCASGHDAAVATVEVMRTAFETINVDDILDTYVQDPKKLWGAFGEDTVKLLAEGSRALAMIWESAWNTPGNTITDLSAIAFDKLIPIYENKDWAPSMILDEIGPVLAGATPPPAVVPKRATHKPKPRDQTSRPRRARRPGS